MKTISLMEEEERRTKAPLLNALKDKIIENIEKKKLSINTDILNEKISTEWLDISRPSRSRQKGKNTPYKSSNRGDCRNFFRSWFFYCRRTSNRKRLV